MSETVAIQIMEALNDRKAERVQLLAHQDAVASGGILPGTIPLKVALNLMAALWVALPDCRTLIVKVDTLGAEVAIEFLWGGTHKGVLALPGMPPIPPTGKTVWVYDLFVYTFSGDKISAVRVESPADGGIPGILAQLGVAMV